MSEAKKPNRAVVVLLVLLLVAALAAIGVLVWYILRDTDDDAALEPGEEIGYAMDSVVVLEPQEISVPAGAGEIALLYRNNAASEDGLNFDCYIGNSLDNAYDMFLAIYADPEFTDRIFLSKLVRPGEGFEHITLDKSLEPGDHEVYVAMTLVDRDENGRQVIVDQAIFTMDFSVG